MPEFRTDLLDSVKDSVIRKLLATEMPNGSTLGVCHMDYLAQLIAALPADASFAECVDEGLIDLGFADEVAADTIRDIERAIDVTLDALRKIAAENGLSS